MLDISHHIPIPIHQICHAMLNFVYATQVHQSSVTTKLRYNFLTVIIHGLEILKLYTLKFLTLIMREEGIKMDR